MNMKRIITLVFVQLVWYSLAVAAQEAVPVNLNISHGLLSNRCWQVSRLDDRTMLIGYPNVFAVYDGARSYPCQFDPRESLGIDGYETNSFSDSSGRLWIKKYKMAYVYDQHARRFLHRDEMQRLLPVGNLRDFFLDSDRSMVVYAKNGSLGFYDFKHAVRWVHNTKVPPVGVTSIGGKRLVFLADASVLIFEGDGFVRKDETHKRQSLPYSSIVCHALDKQNLLIASSQVGLLIYNVQTDKFAMADADASSFVKILVDDSGQIFVVSTAGVKIYNRFIQLTHHTSDIFLDRQISDATLDWQGGLWIATYLNGIYYYNPSHTKAKVVKMKDNHQIVSLCRLDNRYLLYSTQHAIYRFDVKTATSSLFGSQPAPMETLTSVRADQEGHIWISGYGGVYETGADRPLKQAKLGRSYFAIPWRNRIYTTGGPHGDFGYIDRHDMKFMPLAIPKNLQPVPMVLFRAALDSVHQRFIVSNEMGYMFSYDIRKKQWSRFPKDKEFFKRMNTGANAIHCDAEGNVWVASSNGLYVEWNHGKMECFTKSQGLPDNMIRGIVSVKPGQWWIMTATGLVCAERTNKGNLLFFNYDVRQEADGEETVDECLVALDGSVWLATASKLISVSTLCRKKVEGRNLHPILTNIEINGVEYPLSELYAKGNKLHLAYNQNFISLSVSACNYIAREQTSYRYRLAGVDAEWHEAAPRNGVLDIAYTNVDDGKYQFQVEVMDEKGQWGNPLNLTIRITPPWWRTWWAYTLYVILLVVLCIMGYHLWQRRRALLQKLKERHNKMLIQAVKVKPEDLQITSQDELFLQKAVKLVERNMADPNYNVDKLSDDLALSRSHFYRKLHEMTDQSPTLFIRTIRLRRAAQLLKESGLSVSEVAYQCGFNSLASFRKYFKDLYGVIPSEYKEHVK